MRCRVAVAITSLALLNLASCDNPATTVANGALPAINTIIGPVPGDTPPPPAPSNPFSDKSSARADGRRFFQNFNCSGCHGDHAGGGMGPSLRDETWIYGNSEANIFNSIAQGRANGMPAWGVKLPEEEIWKLVSYIRTLRTRDEPQPPQ